MTATLMYHNNTMGNVTLDGESPDGVAAQLREAGYAHVILEPGDATRYTLYLFRHPRVRDMIGVVYDRGTLTAAWYQAGDKIALSDISNNAWTHEFLSWYLDQVLEAL